MIDVIASSRFNRRFKTDYLYQKLVVDVNEFRTDIKSQSDRVYFEPVHNFYNGEILAFNIKDYSTVELFALKTLEETLEYLPM